VTDSKGKFKLQIKVVTWQCRYNIPNAKESSHTLIRKYFRRKQGRGHEQTGLKGGA
jgi:hypothetical protein